MYTGSLIEEHLGLELELLEAGEIEEQGQVSLDHICTT